MCAFSSFDWSSLCKHLHQQLGDLRTSSSITMYTIVQQQQQQQSVQLLHSLVGGEAEPKYNTDQNLFNATHCSALMTHHSFQCSMFNALMILLNALMIYHM